MAEWLIFIWFRILNEIHQMVSRRTDRVFAGRKKIPKEGATKEEKREIDKIVQLQKIEEHIYIALVRNGILVRERL